VDVTRSVVKQAESAGHLEPGYAWLDNVAVMLCMEWLSSRSGGGAPEAKSSRASWHRLIGEIVLIFSLSATVGAQATSAPDFGDLTTYIDKAWETLSRSMTNCETIVDKRAPQHSLLYLPVDYPEPEPVTELGPRCKIDVRRLPKRIDAPGTLDPTTLPRQGVLYLPNPYVVPGGFFNEMYGWDSYFIIRGLLLARRVKMAQGMVENFFFEIDHYGSVLNANRTYFLTRSQPPFLSSMVMAVYDFLADANAKRAWLEKAYPYIQRDYRLWTTGEHLAGDTGLSRYFDYGQGPALDIIEMRDPYYRDVFSALQGSPQRAAYLEANRGEPLIGPLFSFESCEQNSVGCTRSSDLQFTADYYKGDRAMRESGFDVSFRFGPFGGDTHHFAPVCLNSLLYKEETDLERIAMALGRRQDAAAWRQRAARRRELIDRYLWNLTAGMFFDYDFTQKRQSSYQYTSTFYPLWAGLATAQQARAVISHLKVFERRGGLATSPYETGVQWDAPYGWAPLQLISVEGLRRYGAMRDSNRIAREWVATISQNFRREGTIREKYNVVTQSSDYQATAGYKENVVGFGWTNAVMLEFIHQLGAGDANTAKPNMRRRIGSQHSNVH